MSPAATRSRRKAPTKANGALGNIDEAIAYEQAIADEAVAIRAEHDGGMTGELYLKLLPLLKRPIPPGFIVHTGAITGKPYESTGVSSAQVLIDRMDNVLTPLAWSDHATYEEEGKLCKVIVTVVDFNGEVLVERSSWGGVNQGSTRGNQFKSSYTNAAKLAFARVGPGHEVYLGAIDFDPDVNETVAKQQGRPERAPADDSGVTVSDEKARELVDAAWAIGLSDKLGEAVSYVTGEDVGDLTDKTTATAAMRALSPMQAQKVETWLDRKADQNSLEEQIRERNGGEK